MIDILDLQRFNGDIPITESSETPFHLRGDCFF